MEGVGTLQESPVHGGHRHCEAEGSMLGLKVFKVGVAGVWEGGEAVSSLGVGLGWEGRGKSATSKAGSVKPGTLGEAVGSSAGLWPGLGSWGCRGMGPRSSLSVDILLSSCPS